MQFTQRLSQTRGGERNPLVFGVQTGIARRSFSQRPSRENRLRADLQRLLELQKKDY
jgi:hypothetical protein